MYKAITANTLRVLSLVVGLLMPAGLIAQNFSAYNWYFGNSQRAVRFSRSDNSASLVTNQSTPFGQGGSAVASDPASGTLLFYTDGTRVIDATHQPMPNGNGTLLGDNTRNQPVAICAVPGKTRQYYVFHRNNAGTLRFSLVDLNEIGNAGTFGQPPLGNVDDDTVNILVPGLPAALSEAMIILPNSNGTDFWLITHEQGSTNYNVTPITAAGVGVAATTVVTVGFIQQAASFSYHAASKRIAVAPQEAARAIEVLTFTDTPTPSFTSTIVPNTDVNSTTTQAIYDTEFSNNGQYLYVSVHGQAVPAIQADVLQYDLTAASLTAQSVLGTPLPFQSYGLQMAPDSTIYHLYQATAGGPFLLGALTNTDTVASEVNYAAQAFAGDFGGRQFPSFAPFDSLKMKVFFEAAGLCANAPTSFYPTVTPGADSLTWDFGDGSTSSDWSPVHTYASGGAMAVTVTAYLNGQAKDTTQTINITNFDTQISLVQDTTACSCELPYSKQTSPPSPPPTRCGTFTLTAQISGSGSPTWQWFGPAGPGASGSGTSAQLQPDSAGYYYLKATSGGCYTVAGVNIREYGIQDQRANIWYFGQNAGLDFNPLPTDPVVAISNPVMDTEEGTATISDQNGQVIFFTDGNTVWARDFSVLGTGIGGDPGSAQSSLIIPVPGNETLFYIFTTQEVYGSGQYRLSYSLFDLTVGTFGALVKTNVLLFEKSTERITGNGGWLIAHEYGNNSFRAYPITAQGIGNPVISSIGSDHSFADPFTGRGYMKLGPLNRLAVALSTSGVSNVVEIFDFADSTGVVSNFRSVNLNSTTGQVYGIEFGAGGNKVFATLMNTGASKLYEFAFDTLGIPYEIKPPQSANTINETLGAIQVGPDGQLYVAVDGKQYLGMINVNPDTAQISNFNVSGRPLLGGTSSNLGLPNFTQIISDPTQGPSINITGLCFGDSTYFTGSGTDPIDTLAWFFGDGSGVKGVNMTNVQHLYASEGTYTVRLRITNRCVGFITELTRTITITLPPALPITPVAICTPPEPLDANPTGALNMGYLWSTGDTTRVILISNPGAYQVTITNRVTGCSTDATIEAFPSLTTINLGPDSTVCSGTSAGVTLNTNINFPNHTWAIDGVVVPGNTGPTQVVDLAKPGPEVDVYTVEFFDPGSGCFVRDTITFTINPTPGLSITNNGPLSCTPPFTGQLTATVTHVAGAFVSYIVAGAGTGFFESQIDQTPGLSTDYFIPTPGSLGPDTYTMQVTDQTSGCTITDTEIISTNAFTVSPASQVVCGEGIVTIVTNSTLGGTYRIIDPANPNPAIESGTKPADGTVDFETGLLEPGNYLVEVTISGCTVGATVTVTPGPPVPGAAIDITNLCTTSQVTAVPAGATSYTWSSTPAGAFTTAPGNSATATINAGTWLLQVIIDDGTNCPTTVTQSVTVDNFTPAFTYNECEDPVTLIASPVGNYFYRWFQGGVQVGSSAQFSVTSADAAGGPYTLQMQSTASGCPAKSTVATTVNVAGPLTAVINTLTLACTGAPFTLEAEPSRPATSFQWQFEGTNIPGATSAQLVDTREGTYTVNVMAGNCPASADLDLLLLPSTPGQMNDQALICPDPANPNPSTRVALLDPGAGFDSYEWFDATSGTPTPLGITTQTYTAEQAGIYLVELINDLGCGSSDRTTVVEQCDPVIVGPNAFRPSSSVQKDGELVNQQFRLFTFFIDDDGFQIYIFNRWGEMIFESDEREFRWNGGYKNNLAQLLPAGTYSYVVRYKSAYRPEEGIQEKRGGVVLVR